YAPTFAARDSFEHPMMGAIRVQVALRPDLAPKLVIGGMPRSDLPMLLSLLAVTAGLVVAALLQLHRESELSRLRADFVSGVSHELRTPLAQIRMFSETLLLGRVRTDEERVRSLEIVDQEARRLTHLVENLLHFSRSERQATRLSPTAAPLAPLVRVEEQGPGIPAADRERIWDRFWRLERDRGSAVAGTGIGLSVVRELVALHGGRAWAEEGGGGAGARFVLELPLAGQAQAAPGGAPMRADLGATA